MKLKSSTKQLFRISIQLWWSLMLRCITLGLRCRSTRMKKTVRSLRRRTSFTAWKLSGPRSFLSRQGSRLWSSPFETTRSWYRTIWCMLTSFSIWWGRWITTSLANSWPGRTTWWGQRLTEFWTGSQGWWLCMLRSSRKRMSRSPKWSNFCLRPSRSQRPSFSLNWRSLTLERTIQRLTFLFLTTRRPVNRAIR